MSLERVRIEASESNLWDLNENSESAESASPPTEHYTEPDQPESDYTEAEQQAETTRRISLHDDIGELDGIGDWDDDETLIPELQPNQEASPQPITPSTEPDPYPSPTTDTDTPLIAPHAIENRRKSIFTLHETIAMGGVALVLIMIVGFFLLNSLGNLPRITDPYQKPDLPASGNHLTVSKVDSYWRVPISTGPDADVVQRGTALMPILEMTATGSNAALRIQFRNSDDAAVGDPITLAVNGETQLVIPSTAGLEDMNFHNAYRTNLIDPWTAEILEAPAGTTAGSAFRSLITVPISSNRR